MAQEEEVNSASPITEEVPQTPLDQTEDTNSSPITPQKPPRSLIFAVIAALLLVGTVSAAYFFLQSKTSKTPPTASTPTVAPQSLFLSLTSPKEGMVSEEGKVTITGKTLPNKVVVFYTENDSNSAESDQDGNFSGELQLASGINTLTITAYGDKDEEKSESYDLVYDDQVLAAQASAKSEGKNENKNDENRGQAKKEENAAPQATIGNIKDVNSKSITIEESKNKRKTQVNVDKNTRIINQNKKEVNLSKLKPNDRAAVISSGSGKANEKKAVRIFVREASSSASLKQQKRQAIQGIITAISGNTITLAHQIQRDRTYLITTTATTAVKIKDMAGATLADLQVGYRVAVVGDRDEAGNLVALRIHVIPGKATGIYNRYPISTPSGELTATVTPSVTGTTTITPTTTPILSPTSIPTTIPTSTE